MADVIDALKRLERHGAEHSKATEKLKEATRLLAGHVAEYLPLPEPPSSYLDLPRGYSVDATRLLWLGAKLDPEAECLQSPTVSRDSAHQFAVDVAEGWLEEVDAWLAARIESDRRATSTLEKARQWRPSS
jgi:hypothetical protein